jgi:hypothetical protein
MKASCSVSPCLRPDNMNKMVPGLLEQPTTITCQSDVRANENIAIEDVPPDGGYGWVCVAACFTINCFTWGAVSVSFEDNNLWFITAFGTVL